MCSTRFVLLAGLLLIAAPARAQTGIRFAPSPDHTAIADNGDAIVSGYTYTIRQLPANAILVSKPLGKPAPVAPPGGGLPLIDVAIPDFATLSHQGSYTIAVKAVGPGGESSELTSDPFVGPPKATPAPASPGKPAVR